MDADIISTASQRNSSCTLNEIVAVAKEVQTKVGDAEVTQTTLECPQEGEELICKTNSEFVIVATLVDCIDNNESPVKSNEDHVKDETAIASIDVLDNDPMTNDPMDLLELNDRSDINSSRSIGGDPDEAGDESSTGESSSVHTTSTLSNSNNVLEWVKNQKEYSWLLHEENDDMYGYCLFCDANLNIRSISSVKQHSLSLYHKERSDNYLAFREEEERNGLGTPLVQIKQEFGTDSVISALKLKRKTQSEALNNYNWRQWLDECPWLERESPAGTIGYCKYCGIQLNVEFSYLRTRHQETGKHKESAKRYEQTQCNTKQQRNQNDDDYEIQRSDERYRWSQPVEDDNNALRCKICDTKMTKSNFLRHLRTNLHLQNEKKYINCLKREKSKKASQENEEVVAKTPLTWNMYAKQHPWLTADPSDTNYAFCKYCEKRILYGNSVAKRATHENSIQHKYFEKMFKEKMGEEGNDAENANADDEQEEQEEQDAEESADDDEQEEQEEQDAEESADDDEQEVQEAQEEENAEESADVEDDSEDEQEDNNDTKKRISRNHAAWYNQFPWCKKYKIDPKNYCFCSYCKIAIGKSCRKKHNGTARHLVAQNNFLKRHNKKKSLIRSKAFEECFDWAVDIKSHPNLYYCKYCRVRISRHYSKKQHSVSKIHQINQNLYNTNSRKSVKAEDNTENNTLPSASQNRSESSSLTPKQPVVKVPSLITLVKQWQKRSPWLTYKRNELRSDYAFCKVCNQSLYIRSIKNVLKHQRSSKHIRAVNQLRRQKLQQQREQEETKRTPLNKKDPKLEAESNKPLPPLAVQKDNSEELNDNMKESSKESSYKSTIGEMQKRFSWIEKSKKSQYAHCRYCDADIALKILFLRNHSNSQQHRQAVVNYRVAKTKSDKQRLLGLETTIEEDDDIVLVEDNTEEILISEQDDNWTVKSENMDEHEALDYLLQRSGKTNDNNESRQERKLANGEERPSKRVKRSHSFRRLNEGNSSLVASILSTPLTLASCLGPLIKQQIQQITNTQPSGTPPTPSSTVPIQPENSFDLFFKSISETMKKLPFDLAAEGKLKVMQVICDLELKALKRQQPNAELESLGSNSNLLCNSSNSNIPEGRTEANCRGTSDIQTTPHVQCDKVTNETVITPLYTNTSPNRNLQHQISPASASPSFTITPIDGNRGDKGMNSNKSPIIGVMDKNGLHTLQFKNTTLVKKVPTTTISQKNSPNIGNSSIRCIPFKNLTQSVTTEGNTKITRIQVPIPSVTTSTTHNIQSTSNMNTTNTTNKGLNVRNIHIANRSTASQQQAALCTTSTSPLVTTTISDKNSQGSYMTTGNVQRWTTMNGSSPSTATLKQAATPNFNLSAKQTSTPIARNYK